MSALPLLFLASCATQDRAPSVPSRAPATGATTRAFVWPVSGWAIANDRYRWGAVHGASADLAAPYWSPVFAARGGRVQSVATAPPYVVVIDHGKGWRTTYLHLVDRGIVRPGQEVSTGELLGHMGRTGTALNPHCHFLIAHDGRRQVVPGLRIGQWVRAGAFIPGVYAGLDATDAPAPALLSFDVKTVPEGTVLTVVDSRDGLYKVRSGAEDRWIAMSAVEPVLSRMADVMVAADFVDVRAGAGSSFERVHQIGRGEILAAYEEREGWLRIIYGYPRNRYGWIPRAATEPTRSFRAMISADRVDMLTEPLAGAPVVQTLEIGRDRTESNAGTCHENRGGWFRCVWFGKEGWIPGWRTAGRW